MKKIIFPVIVVASAVTATLHAQVGINTTTPSSTLDVVAKNATGTTTDAEGLLIPRVDRQKAQSMTGVATSTLIYVNSIATGTLSGTAANINAIGFYYFDGTVWVKLNSGTASSNDWTITGNAGTTAGTNFIGTTDNQDLIFKRNNVQSGWLNSAANNTAFGVSTLPTTASGTSNAAFGTSALAAVTTGAANIAVGHLAGRSITTGGNNVAIGKNALQGNTASFRNVAIGENALFAANGNENVAVGVNSATAVTSGTNNTVIGDTALTGTTTGTGNVAVGYSALNTNTTGNNNIAIGYAANVNSNNLTNATAIGYNARVNQSNSVVLGATGADAVNVGIGTQTPSATLDVTAKNATGTATTVDGILIPRVDRQRAQSMTSIPNSTLIYVNSIATGTAAGTAINIDAAGFYYFDGSAWAKMNNPVNIYNSNGTLTGNRTVTTGTNFLRFTNGTSIVGITNSATEGRLTATGSSRGSLGLVSGTSNLDIYQDSGSTANITTSNSSTGLSIATLNSTPITLSTSNTARATITSTGNVGIGTTSPAQLLHVQGNARITGSTGTPTTITGRDGNGDISNVTVGTGLSLSGGTLSANAVPISNIYFPFVNVQPNSAGTSYVLDSQFSPNYTIWVSDPRPSTTCSVDLPNPNTMVGRTINIIAAGGDTRVCVPTGQGLPMGNGDNDPFKIIPSYKRLTLQASSNFGGMWTVIAKDY